MIKHIAYLAGHGVMMIDELLISNIYIYPETSQLLSQAFFHSNQNWHDPLNVRFPEDIYFI